MASEVVPPHVEETVAAIAEVHAAHYREAGPAQRLVSGATATIAQPATLALITAAVAGWIVLNLAELHPLDGRLRVTPKLGESGMSQVSWKGVRLVDFPRRRAANLNQGWDGSSGRSRRVDRLAEAADCGA